MNLLNVLRYIAHDSIIYKQERLDYVHRKRFKRNIPVAPLPHTHKKGEIQLDFNFSNFQDYKSV